ncbi:type II toxin-antitoxin system RelB/DinJ family antitoxin [Streptococcus pluranimalium]|uniref:Type II toxin-antitoxin system antitoxin, RelB/DinJ family n=1 Tax=Streptococcus pluranimalium TaxID=82348 RepID=A0A2L0D4Y8_9STRE|nr:type II toxin-antitoxin system RelB/DinJ family antitoxin [Streptococcus pluranimalium]AUW96754.1 type II toxin-antitoxin system antitoxin, RelB/DinJ family [Streptococcus pluranimalium]
MAKTANINLRIEPATKSQAEALFNSFGISVTDAINIFLNTSIMEGGFPFQIKQPRYNQETEAAIKEARQIMAGTTKAERYNSVSELFSSLDEE